MMRRAAASKAPSMGMGLAPTGTRMLSSLIDASTLNSTAPRKSLVTGNDGVHQTMKISKSWRNKPLFRRQGDVRFKTGTEAAQLLVQEALRRDQHESEYINSVTSNMLCLSPIFDRNPKYAFVAKTLMEPERFIQFRVSWIDDVGVVRMNRGFRIQFSSSLGPYEGALHFGSHINDGVIKALGFDAIFSNALTGFDIGAAVGGSDFNPLDKSEAEMQRFCQSYMTELAKYVGPDMDFPYMGMGVGQEEMGYLFGQYKRINVKASVAGRYFLSGDFQEVRTSSSSSSYRLHLDYSKRKRSLCTVPLFCDATLNINVCIWSGISRI
jgi:glutamate dehydrogenase (NADP+)